MTEQLPILLGALPSAGRAAAGVDLLSLSSRSRAIQVASSGVTNTELTQFKGKRPLATEHGYCTSLICGHRCDQAIPHGSGNGLGICNFCTIAGQSVAAAEAVGKLSALTISPAEVVGDSSLCMLNGELISFSFSASLMTAVETKIFDSSQVLAQCAGVIKDLKSWATSLLHDHF